MKVLSILIFLFAGSLPLQEVSIVKVRELYKKAAEQEEAAEELESLLKGHSRKEPLLLGYKGAAHMMMAKHVGNPFSKMSHFNKGKKLFSEAIEADEKNIELRFLRFSVQAEAPGFLGYRDNLEEDKKVLLQGAGAIVDNQLKKMIYTYLLSSKALDDSEKEKLSLAIAKK